MEFRTAKIEDLDTLNRISVRSKRYWGYPESWIESWKDELTIDTEKFVAQSILVVEDKNKILGFSSIIDKGKTMKYSIYGCCRNICPKELGKSCFKKR